MYSTYDPVRGDFVARLPLEGSVVISEICEITATAVILADGTELDRFDGSEPLLFQVD